MNDATDERPKRRFKPSARECALLALHLIDKKQQTRSRPMTRMRLSQLTLQRLWLRHAVTREFLAEVNEWLQDGGWSIFFVGPTYGAVRIEVVETWLSVASKGILDDLKAVATGQFDFKKLEPLLLVGPRERNASAAEREED